MGNYAKSRMLDLYTDILVLKCNVTQDGNCISVDRGCVIIYGSGIDNVFDNVMIQNYIFDPETGEVFVTEVYREKE